MRKVICPLKGELTTDECLSCAKSGGNVCGYDYSLLVMLYQNGQMRPDIHVTDLTMCLRMSYLNKKDPSPEAVGSLINMTSGTMFHAVSENALSEEYISEIPVEWDGLVGRVDLYYPKKKRVVDLKTKRWVDATLDTSTHHEWQVRIYGYMLEKSGRPVDELFIQYIDLAGPSKCSSHKDARLILDGGYWTCPVCGRQNPKWHGGAILRRVAKYPDARVEEFIMDRKGVLQKAMDEDIAPPAEVGWICGYCPHSKFSEKCYEGYLAGGR